MNTCKVSGCINEARIRGFCGYHGQSQPPLTRRERQAASALQPVCSADGCGNKAPRDNPLCNFHQEQAHAQQRFAMEEKDKLRKEVRTILKEMMHSDGFKEELLKLLPQKPVLTRLVQPTKLFSASCIHVAGDFINAEATPFGLSIFCTEQEDDNVCSVVLNKSQAVQLANWILERYK